VRWHKDHHSGQTHDKIEKGAHALRDFVSHGYSYVETFVTIFAASIILIAYLRWYALAAMILAVLTIYIMSRFDKILAANRRIYNKREHKVAATFIDYVTNIKTIITLRLAKITARGYSTSLARLFAPRKKEIVKNEQKWFTVSMFVAFTTFSVLALYLTKVINSGEAIAIGSLVALFGYVLRFTGSFFGFAMRWEDLMWYATNSRAIDSIMAAHRALVKKIRPGDLLKHWHDITVKHLWFQYQDKTHQKHQLKNINLSIVQGEKIALVGESGSGKSTLLHLLRGLDVAQKGQVWIDQRRVPSLRTLTMITTLIPQDPEIFNNTIEYNITVGMRANPALIKKVLVLSRFDVVLHRLPHGLATDIKEKGVNLSGGEKQRLAVARGLYAAQKSSLILLDEPTSSVDSINEAEIYDNILKHFKERTVISAMHRLHLLPMFDTIYLMAQGRIVEHGSFAQLIAKSDGQLAKMWQKYSIANK